MEMREAYTYKLLRKCWLLLCRLLDTTNLFICYARQTSVCVRLCGLRTNSKCFILVYNRGQQMFSRKSQGL